MRGTSKSPVFSMPYGQFAQQAASAEKMKVEMVRKIVADAEAAGQRVTIIDDSIIMEK